MPTNAEHQKASRLRRKLAEGKTLTYKQKQWLDSYDVGEPEGKEDLLKDAPIPQAETDFSSMFEGTTPPSESNAGFVPPIFQSSDNKQQTATPNQAQQQPGKPQQGSAEELEAQKLGFETMVRSMVYQPLCAAIEKNSPDSKWKSTAELLAVIGPKAWANVAAKYGWLGKANDELLAAGSLAVVGGVWFVTRPKEKIGDDADAGTDNEGTKHHKQEMTPGHSEGSPTPIDDAPFDASVSQVHAPFVPHHERQNQVPDYPAL